MDKKRKIVLFILVILLAVSGFAVFRVLNRAQVTEIPIEETDDSVIPPVDPSVTVSVLMSKSKDNTVVLSVKGLPGNMVSIGYELTYDSKGLIKGVNSGSKPLDVTGKTEFEREIYLGTCSRNVCRPDAGVSGVTVALEFTDSENKKSQFSREYDL